MDRVTSNVEFKVRPEAGGDLVTVSLDVFTAYPAAAAIFERYPDALRRSIAWVHYLTTLGWPRLSAGDAGNAEGPGGRVESRSG